MFIRRPLSVRALSLVVLAPLACVHASFVPTDARYAAARVTNPRVYVDHLPPRPYRSVGIIEVRGPDNQMDLAMVIDKARSAGAEAGCDVVVDRAIHAVDRGADLSPEPGMMLAQYRPYGSSSSYYSPAPFTYVQPTSRREFICGIYQRDS
jgi:hypothetical protein